MFGFVSKRKILKEAVEMYLFWGEHKFDPDKTPEHNSEMFWYSEGNANALNGLCSRLGIDLTEAIKFVKTQKRKDAYRQWKKGADNG